MQRIRRPATWPQWQSEILSVGGPEELRLGDEVEGRARLAGFEVQGRSVTTEIGPDVMVEDVLVGVRMKVLYRVEETSQGSLITRRLEAYLPRGFAGRILSLILIPRLRRMQEKVLDRLST